MRACNSIAVLAMALCAVPSVVAQFDMIGQQRGPPPSPILSPSRNEEFAYGGVIPFAYNWTYDTSKESHPVLDVLIGRGMDQSAIEVALGLNCKHNICDEDGVMKVDIDLAKWSRFLGIGGVTLYTVERIAALMDGDVVSTRRTTAQVAFRVGLEPLTASMDRSQGLMMFQQW